MANGCGQFDMTHPLTANLTSRDLYAASFANDALVLDFFVPAAGALPVLDWSEDALTEQAVSFWLERAVIDSFRLFDFPMRPTHDVFTARDSDSDLVEQADVCHKFLLSPNSRQEGETNRITKRSIGQKGRTSLFRTSGLL
jgi:hypothetical protein